MAHSTLPSLPSPAFPQDLIALVTRVLGENRPTFCEFESAECRFPCGLQAVVTDLETERDLCAGHFGVSLG